MRFNSNSGLSNDGLNMNYLKNTRPVQVQQSFDGVGQVDL